MENLAFFVLAGVMVLGLIAVIILMMVFHRQDTRELRDRLMSRDFHDYSVNKLLQKAQPAVMSDAQMAEDALGMTAEDKEVSDRLPVS